MSEPRSDKAVFDEEEQKSTVTSSKPMLLDVGVEGRASSLKTDTDEPGQRRRQSNSKRAKKATKVKGRGQSPRPSDVPPTGQYGVEDLEDLIPDDQLRATIARMGRLNRGYKATSESACSAASKMSSLMFQMGKEHQKLEKAREAEKELEQVTEADHWTDPERVLGQLVLSQCVSQSSVEPELESLDEIPDEEDLDEDPNGAGSD